MNGFDSLELRGLARRRAMREVRAIDPASVREQANVEDVVGLMPTLLATARFLVGNETDARDLTQSTLEIAIRRLPDLRDRSKLRSWLLAIEAHEAGRIRRRVRRMISLDLAVHDVVARMPDEASLDLHTALGRLPRRARTAVVLHYMADLSVADTAAAMSVKENTVKTELATGMRRLREDLDGQTNR